MRLLSLVFAGLLLAATAFGYSGSGGVWAQKSGDFVSKNFAGTRAGIQAAIDYIGTGGGNVTVWPGTYTIDQTIHIYQDNINFVGSNIGATVFNCTSGDTAFAVMPASGIKTNGWSVENITFQVGAAYTGPLVYFNGGDFYWSVRNVKVLNPTSGFASDIGVQFMNCQNGVIENLWVRSDDLTNVFQIGVDADINDSNQRGNLSFTGLFVSNALRGLFMCRSGPSNSLNNCTFTNCKWANSASLSKDNKTAITLYGQADQTAFINAHVEGFQFGLLDSLGDGLQVIGGLFTKAENDAGNAGYAISIVSAEGSFISTPRIHDVYDGIKFSGVCQETFFIEGRKSSIGGTYFSDTSTGLKDKNTYFLKNASATAFGFSGIVPDSFRVIGTSNLIGDTEIGYIASDSHSTVLSVDGGSTGTQELRLQRNNQTDLALKVQGSSATRLDFRTDLTIGSPAGTNFGKWLTTTGKLRLGDATTPTHGLEVTTDVQVADSVRVGSLLKLGLTTFAALGTPDNRTIIYCSDCTKATPCGSGGSGALAKRINGAWDCD